MKKYFSNIEKSQKDAFNLTDVKSFNEISQYLDSLYTTLYEQRKENILGTSALIFSNPMLRFTISKYNFVNNSDVFFYL